MSQDQSEFVDVVIFVAVNEAGAATALVEDEVDNDLGSRLAEMTGETLGTDRYTVTLRVRRPEPQRSTEVTIDATGAGTARAAPEVLSASASREDAQ